VKGRLKAIQRGLANAFAGGVFRSPPFSFNLRLRRRKPLPGAIGEAEFFQGFRDGFRIVEADPGGEEVWNGRYDWVERILP
jgi:hypothetical protein